MLQELTIPPNNVHKGTLLVAVQRGHGNSPVSETVEKHEQADRSGLGGDKDGPHDVSRVLPGESQKGRIYFVYEQGDHRDEV